MKLNAKTNSAMVGTTATLGVPSKYAINRNISRPSSVYWDINALERVQIIKMAYNSL